MSSRTSNYSGSDNAHIICRVRTHLLDNCDLTVAFYEAKNKLACPGEFGQFARRLRTNQGLFYSLFTFSQKSENVRPHFSNSINNRQSSRENWTPSSGTLQRDELVFRLVRISVTNFPPLPSKVGLILAWLLHRSRQGRWGPWQWGQERLPPRASLGLRQATSTKFSNLIGNFSLNCWFSVSRHSK